MAASRLLRAVAAFVILLSFAAGLRKSYWSGCMRHSDLSANFLHFGVSDLLSKNICNKCFKIVLRNNSTWLDDKESDDAVLRRQYRLSGKLCGPFNQSLLMLRWSADKVLPQRFHLSFDCRGLGVRCYEPHPGVNCCASVASPFIWPCEPQNASVTWFWFLCALLRTAQ